MSVARLLTYLSAGLLAYGIAIPPRASADEWNEKTIFTFSGPVEIPGRVLDPGTYVFKLADSLSDRNIVEVFNKNENHLYGIFLAIPDYHLKPAGKPIITFEERAAGAPEAVKAWFYPGDNYGHEFVYPKVRAAELARVNHQPVPSMPNELATNTIKPTQNMNEPHVMAMKKAPLKAEQPSQQEVEITEVFPPPPPATTAPATNAAANMPKRLPQTGSTLPLFGLVGILSLGVAASLRLAAVKMK
jgi:LPXTG-motif cell wall-anchored protein